MGILKILTYFVSHTYVIRLSHSNYVTIKDMAVLWCPLIFTYSEEISVYK